MKWAGPLGGLALAAGALVSPVALAATSVPELDSGLSRAGIEVDLRVGGRVQGTFGRIEGRFERLEDGRLQVIVRLDAQGLVLDGPGWMARSMRSHRFLDVEAHPWIHFRSAPFDPALVESGGEMAGELVLREVARPVAFQVDPEACAAPGYDCDIHVSGAVSRRQFGMDAYRIWLKDEVGFDFRVRLRQPEAP
ncbi:YceI family protein [Arenimonas caeni]|jgi:polyisoprenoid-binding protein YceI|uniref:YceI family protein n=1 Tax=Arenimonas caeni TaxID=2058085 RepID=UPI002A36B965|nr:YceI family protein [Arenimonas caeni]MDY0022830.1 YceI family protein [Arenimonas caeni]